MILADDHENLSRILGTEMIPEAILSEYEQWLRMYHLAGASGALPIHMLICMLRQLGISARSVSKGQAENINWHNIDNGTRVLVQFDSGVATGVLRGTPSQGMLAVLLDGETYVRSVEIRRVRLEPSDMERFMASETPVESVAKAETPSDAGSPPAAAEKAWGDVAEGAAVWVLNGNDVADGKYVGLSKDGQLRVKVDGKVMTVDAETVQLNA